MARVFITGSADGLGLLAGKKLQNDGHEVVFHARNQARTKVLPDARWVIGDVSTLAAMRSVAEQANAAGPFDAVIHNVGIYRMPRREETVDGLEMIFAINTLAPYVLTALITRPRRLVYLSSALHRGGTPDLADPQYKTRPWTASAAYADSKLHDVLFAFAFARKWPEVRSNALEPGWVPTKMGGESAPDDLALGAVTQAWLATSDDAAALQTARYFFHQKEHDVHPSAHDERLQDELLAYCAEVSGVTV